MNPYEELADALKSLGAEGVEVVGAGVILTINGVTYSIEGREECQYGRITVEIV